MRPRHLTTSLLLLAALACAALAGAAPDVKSGFPSVAIQKRRIVLVRTGKILRDFPEKRRAVVNYPVVGGPRNSPVLRKVRSLLEIKNIFDTSLEEYRREAWLTELDYEVNYNRNFILDITFRQEGVGAYPDTQTKHLTINLRNGELIRGSDAFEAGSLQALAAAVDSKLQAEIQGLLRDNGDARENRNLYKELKFKIENLDDFSVSDKGITFLFDAGFPHVVQALEPNGSYFFSYAELKQFIKRNGPLRLFVR